MKRNLREWVVVAFDRQVVTGAGIGSRVVVGLPRVDSFAEAIAAVKDLKHEGIVGEYAIGGAMALIFWSEPTATFDLDVFVLLHQEGPLVSRARGYPEKDEHIVVSGVPVQVIPAPDALAEEAIAAAVELDYARPEYLIALYLQPTARARKRLERVATLVDEDNLDHGLLDDV